MTTENKSKFTVITNNYLESKRVTKPIEDYHTNPMYEKLLKFTNDKKRRFTVEDLLKW